MILSTGSQWFSHSRIEEANTVWHHQQVDSQHIHKKGPPTAIHKMLESQSSLSMPPLLVELWHHRILVPNPL